MSKRLFAIAALLLVLTLTACPGPTPPPASQPEIGEFTAAPEGIEVGSESVLTWNVSRAEKLVVTPGNVDVTAKSSLNVSPAATTTYTLTASNKAGSVKRDVKVTVLPPDDSTPSITVTPKRSSVLAGDSPVDFTATLVGSSEVIQWTLEPASGAGTLSPASGTSTTYTPPTNAATRTEVTLTATAGSLSAAATIILLPNPYPRVISSGLFSLNAVYAGGVPTGCEDEEVAKGETINLAAEGCNLTLPSAPPRYWAKVEVENPGGEALTYDWRVLDGYDAPTVRVVVIDQALGSTSPTFAPHTTGANVRTATNCRVNVKINAPDPIRSKSFDVWNGKCSYLSM